MLLDARKFAFAAPLQGAFATFRADLERLSEADFVPWPVTAAYSGRWLVYPLFLVDMPQELAGICDFAANQRRCAASTQVLRAIPGIVSAAFSWLAPGTHIYPHVDKYHDHVIRGHLALCVPDDARLRVAGEVLGWRTGEITLFDGQKMHETANLSAEPRVVLLVDYVMTPEEERQLGRDA